MTSAKIAHELEREPLVGVTAAAKLLGIKPPNFKRDAAPRLTRVPVEGSADVYFRSEVERLATERAQTRAARANGDAQAA
jgi:hypothetical protein